MADSDCLFCKIVAGDIPSHKVHETDDVLCFLDINPLAAGHTLVIPKHHGEKLHDLPESAVTGIGPALLKVQKAIGCEDYNVLQNNGAIAHQVVKHVHFHVIPKPTKEEGVRFGVPGRWPLPSPSPPLFAGSR
jgi:diadenosine tetraphosphate (Ap4A) HIT family hydrolase